MKEILLTHGRVAFIEDEDFDRFGRMKWHVYKDGNTWYAAHNERREGSRTIKIRLHRAIMKPPDGYEVDHIDGNGLNCIRSNMRICSHKENGRNRKKQRGTMSSYKGVSWDGSNRKWRAKIYQDKKQISLGYFANEISAALAYDKAARELFGEYARLNFNETRR